VFVALGGDETAGASVSDPAHEDWTQLFYRQALTSRSTLYDESSPTGMFVEDLDGGEVRQALALHPDLVTVWVGLENLIEGMPASTFERDLGSALVTLRSAGVRVLVATLLPVNRFPGYATCEQQPLTCGLPTSYLPPASQLESLISSYDSAIEHDAAVEHDPVADVTNAFDKKLSSAPALVDDTDLGLTPAGEQLVAQTFESAYAS
jgi:acyl-CoA thioesterase I